MAAPPDRATEDAGGGSDAQLPDLSTDTTSASIVVRPSFEQLNATLFSRGYLRAPLNVAGLPQHSVEALADALHAIIAQREEDLEVRSVLTAKTRTLTASLERAKRFLKDEGEKCADSERKAEAAKAKAAAVQHALQAEQLAHKATKDALTKSRRELQLVKASALQHRASSDRNVARVRARIGEVTGTALRLSVPDFRIVSSAFDESLPGSGSAKARAPTLAEEQVEELERNRAELVDYNRALKRLATEAINAVRRADAELLDMVEAEEQDSQKKATAGAGPSASSSSSDLASSSYGSGGASQSASKKRASTSDAWLQGHGALFQRDLFPAAHPLTTAAAAAAVAGASGSRAAPAHPALQALSRATDHFADHVQTLLDLRTTRLVHEAESRKRDAIEAKESSWQAQLHSEVKAEIEGDAQFSVNRHDAVLSVNGALTANKKQVWQEEKKELERKLLDTVKRLAVAEQNVARREKELRKLEESERRARRLIDEQQRQQQQQPTAKEGDKEEDGAKAGKESSASNIEAARNELQREFDEAKAEKRRYAKLSETLERDREQLERAREKLRAERAESRAMSAAAAAATTATQLQQDQPAPARRTVSRLDASEMPARPAAAIERLPPVIEGLELSPAADEGGDKMELDDAPAAEAVPALSPSHPATAELAVAPAGEAPGSAVATGSNPELDAIFGRAFSALATTSMSSPPSTAKAATRTPVEKPRRQSSRLSSSSSTPPTSDVVAAESAAVPTTEKRKSRRISERSEDRHEEAATVSEGSERKRRRVETESSLAERRSSNSSGSTTGRRSRTEVGAPPQPSSSSSSTAPAAPSSAATTSRSTRRPSTRERLEQERPSSGGTEDQRRPAASSRTTASSAPLPRRPRPAASSSSSSAPTAAAGPAPSEDQPRRPSASRVTAPTASSLNRRVASSSSAAGATREREKARGEKRLRDEARDARVLDNATNRVSSRDKGGRGERERGKERKAEVEDKGRTQASSRSAASTASATRSRAGAAAGTTTATASRARPATAAAGTGR